MNLYSVIDCFILLKSFFVIEFLLCLFSVLQCLVVAPLAQVIVDPDHAHEPGAEAEEGEVDAQDHHPAAHINYKLMLPEQNPDNKYLY